MRLRLNAAAAGLVGGLICSGAALAQQPINLLAPTPLSPSTRAATIQATPQPPPTALSPAAGSTTPPGPAVMTLSMPPATATPPPQPMITKALLPGHWQLSGWQYHWVPPEIQLRPVETRPFVPGHHAWRDGAWVWVASHYGEN